MTGTKRQEQKEATRSKLLGVAKRLFAEHGYEAVGMREVAVAAGTSTGAIFANFTGKAALFEAATGEIPPDVARFLDKLLHADSMVPVGEYQTEADRLKSALYGARVH